MSKIFINITIFILLILNVKAEDQVDKLNQLFKELKTTNVENSYNIEQQIWKIWSTHPTDEKKTLRLNEGANLMGQNQLLVAIDIITEVIELDPNWAEAWNKRATAYYLVGNYQKSQDDIDKVLKLEERHFGAWAGQGLVNIQLKNYEKAIMSYKKAKEIYPTMRSPDSVIKELEKTIKENLI
ncbi:MAG: tetratricopeptide repeat protein [Pelagibacteraceae bacterium]|nr:tetratricopeptide repeat protein [Pelagibacteraceae bacterium]PHX88794.1 MAG: 2-hydroxy-6-oxo-2,4-heptadienoate hydrolase [Pelagibacteraceae bacterium]